LTVTIHTEDALLTGDSDFSNPIDLVRMTSLLPPSSQRPFRRLAGDTFEVRTGFAYVRAISLQVFFSKI